MKNGKILKMLSFLGICLLFGLMFAVNGIAATEGEEIILRKTVIGVYQADGSILYVPQEDPARNRQAIEYLLENDESKTLIFPSGQTIEVEAVIDIGDNTTIIADGATIIQVNDGLGLIKHTVDKVSYKSISHVTIQGGTWKNVVNNKGCTMFRFVHGSDLNFKDVTVETNYQGHALELIACKDVIVEGCQLYAANDATKSKDSVEEALQIDIATPKTAPGVLASTGDEKFVKGQTCSNITIKNCTVSGSRGICANFASSESKYKNKFHTNITITNCKATGESAEGIVLFNTVGATIKNCTIRSNSTRKDEAYSIGLHLALMGKNKISTEYTNVILGNKIYGYRQALQIYSHTSFQYGKTTVKNNKAWASKKETAYQLKSCKKLVNSKNTAKKRT